MWLWMMAAPCSMQAKASAAISSGVRGTWGLRSLLVTPLIAASMITGRAVASVALEEVVVMVGSYRADAGKSPGTPATESPTMGSPTSDRGDTSVITAISADSHVTEPGDCYVGRIDPSFSDRAPVAVTDKTMGAAISVDNGRAVIPYGMIAAAGRPWEAIGPFVYVGWDELHAGGWDPKARLAEQDRDGVGVEVLYPSVGMLLCNHPDADYKHACFEAYNRWLAEYVSTAPERLVGLGQTALRSVEEGVADLEAIKALGLRGVMLPGLAACHDEGDYDDPRWDPLWRASVELGLPVSFHILTGGGSLAAKEFRGPKMNAFLGIIRGCQDVIGTMIFGGVFDRVPDLKIVCTEADAGWVPHWMYRADHAVQPAPQLARVGRAGTPAERVLQGERLRDVPGRLGRVPDGTPDEPRAAPLGE